ncbi:DUF2787 family protein [Shewanella algae]|uniref:DUF2787 family protein n=1 Tax=Shewanella algae TaxID=38313 RepID=UPI000BB5B576|nr:DUF2787 family protein [Shewanella algae]PBQ28600.1 hypothetical protein AYI97_06070 [Shewanella algae]QNH98460.1 DUF2787 family protein [Shewanella algae]QNI00036.1 DUF2787 family protein [Shewanella algae]
MNIIQYQALTLPADFYELLKMHAKDYQTQEVRFITLNFADPDYNAERGGFHPVEIGLSRQGDAWALSYFTDFAFYGRVMPELEREIDVHFQAQEVYSTFYGTRPLREVAGLVQLLLKNFLSYVAIDAYVVKVQTH